MQTQKQNSLIKLGDIIELGPHRLLCGNACDINNVKKLIGKDKIDLVLTDPPYGVAYVESKAGFTQNLAMPKEIENDHLQTENEYIVFSEKWLKVLIPFLNHRNSIYIFNSDKMIFALRQAMINVGLYFSQLIIWVKSNAVIGRLDYLPQHELIAYSWYGRHAFKKSKDKSILFCPKPTRSKLHPTQKPISLLRRLILNSSGIGDVVYDPFGGSGSTLTACNQTKRKCLMVEIDSEYCATIIRKYYEINDLKN
jgi:DNA modification methylase